MKNEKNQLNRAFLQRNLHFKDQEASDKVTNDSLLGELSLLQVIKTSKKGFPSIEIVKGNGREMCVTLQREAGLRLK